MASAQTADQASGDNGGSVPHIVVSDAADKRRGKRAAGSPTKRKGSTQQGSTPSTARSGSGLESERSSPLSQSLSLPSHRARSDSNPPPRRPSHCPAPSTSSSDLRVPENPRGRSNSFSGIQPARRRGSIQEQWGSISERNRPAMGSLKGRRGSVDMENLLRDLSFGVQHNELMAPEDRARAFSDKQWEELKQCRYLRVPSRNSSVEEISEDGE